uniref:Uncharacterized protein n=1 Tax=viral metagenome TaxID=1070528 RepID=A0A6C0C9N2_9ZZZZ
MNPDLTYGYVKFVSNDSSPTYVLVCLEIMSRQFEEFKTIKAMMNEMQFEYCNDLKVLNHFPIEMLYVFKILVRYVTIQHMIPIDSIDEQTKLLHLLCKMANKKQINQILCSLKINPETWIRLLDEGFDAKNYLDTKHKIDICKFVAENANLDEMIYINFLGLPYFENLADYEIMNYVSFPRKRVYDKTTDTFYDILRVRNYVVLFGQNDHIPETRIESSSNEDISNESNGDELDDLPTNLNDHIIKLSWEMIRHNKIYNFLYDWIDVYFAGTIKRLILVESTNADRYTYFCVKYAADYNKIHPSGLLFKIGNCPSSLKFSRILGLAYKEFCRTKIYVSPTIESTHPKSSEN